ncbi:hypothetical protein [Subtercola vilae]|uniref:hypothetical protein n=1 Tax=Subtercola vilae TaxID=2056433 RepID=UPI0010AA25B7|nr:hypothetical protein [Subtercola vilae]
MLGPIGCGITDGIGGVIGAGVQAVSFATDPLGYVLSKIQEATAGLSGTVLPALVDALKPDFSAAWWIQCYEASFGIAVLVFVILIIVTLARAGRHEMGGREAFESVFEYGPLFLAGTVFGPIIGATFSNIVSAATDGVTAWGLGGTQTAFLTTLSARFASKDVAGITGGAVVGIIVMLVVLLALIGAVVICIVQLAAVYLSAALIPLGIVWLIDPRTRSFAKKAPLVVVGIIASHFFLFFLLAIGFFAISGLGLSWADPASTAQQNGLVVLVNLVTVGVIMGLVVFAPMGLLAFAKVASPLGNAGHASSGGFTAPGSPSSGPSGSPSGGNSGGDGGESQLTSVANEQSAAQVSPGSEAPANTDVSSSASAPTTGAGSPGAPSTAMASESGAAAAASSTEAVGATGAAGAAGAEGVAAGATGIAEGAAAAGAAESATGVGAAVGVPTLIAAAALSAASKGAQMAESTAGHAAEAAQD